MEKELKEATLIAISGKQYAGKDLLTRLLMERLPGFRQIPLALAIKQAYAQKHGLSLQEIEASKAEHRAGLIAMGDWGRRQDPYYWLKKVLAEPGKKIVSDVRLRREYELLKRNGAYMIRLHADRDVRAARGRLTNEDDPTETQLDDVQDWDLLLINNGAVADLVAQLEIYL